jgi:pimeloyl-ACP methyl ester carboxylesterase
MFIAAWQTFRNAHPIRSFLVIQSIFLALSLGIYGLASFQIHHYEAGITRDSFTISSPIPTPVLRFRPATSPINTIAVLAHGYSADKELMSSFAVDLARQGITAYTFDFPGHGASTVPYGPPNQESIGKQIDPVLAEVVQYALHHAAPNANLVLIGYSMGTIAVSEYAIAHPELANLKATIMVAGISPDKPTISNPPNLLVLSGQFDLPGINDIAQHMIASACNVPAALVSDTYHCGPSIAGVGSYRERVVLPMLDHISIVTAGSTHHETIDWLHAHVDARIGTQPIDPDARMRWFLLGLLAAFFGGLPVLALAAIGLKTRLKVVKGPSLEADAAPSLAGWQGVLAVAGALGVALVILRLIMPTDFWAGEPPPFGFLAQMVSADVAIFLLVAGIALWGIIMAIPALRNGVIRPTRTDLLTQIALAGITTFFLYITIGTLSAFAWENLTLDPVRLWRAVVYTLMVWPFFAGMQMLIQMFARHSTRRGLVADIGGMLLILGSFVLAIVMNFSRLSYLGILFPIVAIVFVLFLRYTAWTRAHVPAPAILNATLMSLALGWIFAATLPLR